MSVPGIDIPLVRPSAVHGVSRIDSAIHDRPAITVSIWLLPQV
jgi:hypothetical protein